MHSKHQNLQLSHFHLFTNHCFFLGIAKVLSGEGRACQFRLLEGMAMILLKVCIQLPAIPTGEVTPALSGEFRLRSAILRKSNDAK